MPLSLILKKECPTCGKVIVEKSRLKLGNSTLISTECGHMVSEEFLSEADYSTITSEDGHYKLMPFQVETIKQLEAANGRALIAHEQGLGKTVIVDAFLKLHLESLRPVVLVTKTTLKMQHQKEFIRWTGNKLIQVVMSGKEMAVPDCFDIYITTYDMLKNEKVWSLITPKTLILDECQAIKDHLSGRGKAVQKFVADKAIEHVIGLSGTPVENHAGEYFTILNLLRPTMFPSYAEFMDNECDSIATTRGWKVGGLRYPKYFHEKTKDFIFRKTQEEVLPDLFALQLPRKFHHVELDRRFNKAYAAAIDELEEMMYGEGGFNNAIAIAIYSKLRQITGISKTVECVDFVTEHIISTGRKIVIFVHHHSVMDLLESNLNSWLSDGGFGKAVCYRAGDTKEVRVAEFTDPNRPVMICSTRAAGEGLDGLQYLANDVIMLERQWNPSKEEQAEKRIGRFGQTKPCNYIYMIASGTIDEYFTQLVEQKRMYTSQALDNKDIQWNEQELMKELAMMLIAKGSKAWKL